MQITTLEGPTAEVALASREVSEVAVSPTVFKVGLVTTVGVGSEVGSATEGVDWADSGNNCGKLQGMTLESINETEPFTCRSYSYNTRANIFGLT